MSYQLYIDSFPAVNDKIITANINLFMWCILQTEKKAISKVPYLLFFGAQEEKRSRRTVRQKNYDEQILLCGHETI